MGRQSTYPPPPLALDLPAPTRIADRQLVVPQFIDARRSHRRWVRVLNELGGSLEPFGRPDADRYWEIAQRRQPNAGEPTSSTQVALRALVDSLNEDAALNFIGKIAARIDCTRIATTHLRVEKAIRETPDVTDVDLPAPLFVLGLFRSGTTFLHRLLAQDPDSRTLPHWESFDPVHTPGGPEARQRKLTFTLGLADLLSPSVKAIHPMDAHQIDECRALFTNVFRTLQFNVQYRVPSYVDWLLRQDARIAYRDYRRQLQLIHHHRPYGKRFVLKDPTHTFFVDTIVELFPNARFIFIHRDPVDTLSSICSLHAYARSIFSSDVDAKALGRELPGSYMMSMLESAVTAVDRLPLNRVAHVRSPDLGRDPLATATQVYRDLGMELGQGALNAMQGFIRTKREAPGPRHIHSADGFGFDPSAVRERFADYCDRFDLMA
jgi:hypothetical protein